MQNKWLKIIQDLKDNPRDLHTVPKNNANPKWFYAYTDGDKIYVENAKEHTPSSSISLRRALDFTNFEKIYPIHLRRENGEQVSQEATKTTVNQVYWYSVITFCLQENNQKAVSKIKANQNNTDLKSNLTIKPKEKGDNRVEGGERINLFGYEFKYIQTLSPQRNSDGSIELSRPQEKYSNIKNLPLSKYGRGEFCTFTIETNLDAGVYLWVLDNEIIYIGETINLKSRFNQGYGQIHPRNCYVGGQNTNCKMNKVVLEYALQGKEIELYFYPTKEYKKVELALLKSMKTKYNVKDNS